MYYEKKKRKKMYHEKKKNHPRGDYLYFIFRKMETHVSGVKEHFIKKNENGSPGDVSVNLIPN